MADLAVDKKQKLESRNKWLTKIYFIATVTFVAVFAAIIVVILLFFDYYNDSFLYHYSFVAVAGVVFSAIEYIAVVKKGVPSKKLFIISLAIPLGIYIVVTTLSFNAIRYCVDEELVGFFAMLLYLLAYAAEIIGAHVYSFKNRYITIPAMLGQALGLISLFCMYKEEFNDCSALLFPLMELLVVWFIVRILHYLLATKWYCDNCGNVCSYDMIFCKKCGSKNPILK